MGFEEKINLCLYVQYRASTVQHLFKKEGLLKRKVNLFKSRVFSSILYAKQYFSEPPNLIAVSTILGQSNEYNVQYCTWR
jgi:hypothetical protein